MLVDAGFSIVTYTGNGSAGATIGHGLSKAPEWVIVKTRSATDDWYIYYGDPTDYIRFDTRVGEDNHVVWNDTAPTASVFSVGTANGLNNGSLLAFCFHSVDGYSKVGTYSGNGSTDGTFVYTGFRPAFVMTKSHNSARHWAIADNKRGAINPSDDVLMANLSSVETDGAVDLLSNGFKIRINYSDWNNSSGEYIYIAFAETPFKYSNAR